MSQKTLRLHVPKVGHEEVRHVTSHIARRRAEQYYMARQRYRPQAGQDLQGRAGKKGDCISFFFSSKIAATKGMDMEKSQVPFFTQSDNNSCF